VKVKTFLLLALAACGSSTNGQGGQPDGGQPAGACPATAPSAGSACTVPWDTVDGGPALLDCEYGGDPNLGCNVVMQCTSMDARWVAVDRSLLSSAPTACPSVEAAGSALCPPGIATLLSGMGPDCSVQGFANCSYPEGRCQCRSNMGTSTWTCENSPADGCPRPRPRLGSSCSDTDAGQLQCDYGYCFPPSTYGASQACFEGHWEYASGQFCPG
jgi:hypothetical protein